MAYDAAVELKQFILSIQRVSGYDPGIPKSQVEFISKELPFLGQLLKLMRLSPRKATMDEHSQTRVKNAILKLDDLIYSYIYGRESLSSQQLLQVRQEITFISETWKTDKEYEKRQGDSYSNFTSTTSGFVGKKKMVGLHDQLNQLKDLVLTESEEDRLIMVTGMTGIGKTTIVQEIYKDPLVAVHFEAYLFLPFGPRCQLKEILLLALHQLGVHSDKFQKNDSVQQLQDYVKESLSGRRYLVVLDDVWNDDSGFLEARRNILPHHQEVSSSKTEMSSCIIITTQNRSLISSDGTMYVHIRLLDDNESWDLLRETVYASSSDDQEQCRDDRQLEKIGKKIAKKCEGLPLAIIQVGELLRRIGKTVENWREIAEREDPLTITREDNTPLSNALSLSYTMLPHHLKLCFLYMGVFPKSYDVISRSKIIQLWVSEGFIRKAKKKNLDETAGEYLDELVRHSCVLSKEARSIRPGETKLCRLHFTFRGLCVSEAKRDKVFHIIRKYADSFPENVDNQQKRVCIHNNIVLGFKQVHEWMESVKDMYCSLLCFGPQQQYPIVLHLPFGLLRILDAFAIRFYEFPHQVLGLVRLRYFAITLDQELPPSISLLQSLEVLISRPHHDVIKTSVRYLPMEIWKMRKLKHIRCMGFDLPDPSSIDEDGSLVLGRLLTLSGVTAHSCTRGVLARIPRLKKIGVKIDSFETDFSLLGNFSSPNHAFETFKCVVMYSNLLTSQVVPINFPTLVKKISLSGCGFPWEYMKVIGALPSLQVLKLRCYAFRGPEWITDDYDREQFPKLESLLLEDLDVGHWEFKYLRHFSLLKRLVIRHCYKLQRIPTEFLEMDQLEVDNCSLSLVKQVQFWRTAFLYPAARIYSAWDNDHDKN